MTESSEYLTETFYAHPCSKLGAQANGMPSPDNLYAIASYLLTTGYCAHRETSDNGEMPRAKIKEILGDWLTEDRERNLFLRHAATLDMAAEAIAEQLFEAA